VKQAFEPWKDFDLVKREVRDARKDARPIGWKQREWTWCFCKREQETKKEWLERMTRHETMFEKEE